MQTNAFNRLHGATIEEALNGGRPVLTAKQFLGKEDGRSYFKPQLFIEFAKSLRPMEVEDLEQTLLFMQEGLRFAGSLRKRKDRGGRTYVYLNALEVNATLEAKYILEGPTIQFLKDYIGGKFVVGFTLDELVEEALNS